jgi:hypothetical protein
MRAWAVLAALLLGGCVVKPYERELLARPNKQLDDERLSAAGAHVLESREGSAGGKNSVGSGCGCN